MVEQRKETKTEAEVTLVTARQLLQLED